MTRVRALYGHLARVGRILAGGNAMRMLVYAAQLKHDKVEVSANRVSITLLAQSERA